MMINYTIIVPLSKAVNSIILPFFFPHRSAIQHQQKRINIMHIEFCSFSYISHMTLILSQSDNTPIEAGLINIKPLWPALFISASHVKRNSIFLIPSNLQKGKSMLITTTFGVSNLNYVTPKIKTETLHALALQISFSLFRWFPHQQQNCTSTFFFSPN